MYIKKFSIPIYGGCIKVIISSDPTFSDVNKQFGTKANDDYIAFVFQDKNNGDYSIVIPPDVSNANIAHETVHLVNMIFGYVGIKPKVNNDEPQAYLTGWIFEQVENVLNKYKAITKEVKISN